VAQTGACKRPNRGPGYIVHAHVLAPAGSAGFIWPSEEGPPVGFLAGALGFGLSIVASILIYAYAFNGAVWLIDQIVGQDVGVTGRWIVMFVLLFLFISVGVRVGRFARSWIEAGAPRGAFHFLHRALKQQA